MVHPVIIPDQAMDRLEDGGAVEIRDGGTKPIMLFGSDDADAGEMPVWEIPRSKTKREIEPYHLPTFESIGFEPADPVEADQ